MRRRASRPRARSRARGGRHQPEHELARRGLGAAASSQLYFVAECRQCQARGSLIQLFEMLALHPGELATPRPRRRFRGRTCARRIRVACDGFALDGDGVGVKRERGFMANDEASGAPGIDLGKGRSGRPRRIDPKECHALSLLHPRAARSPRAGDPRSSVHGSDRTLRQHSSACMRPTTAREACGVEMPYVELIEAPVTTLCPARWAEHLIAGEGLPEGFAEAVRAPQAAQPMSAPVNPRRVASPVHPRSLAAATPAIRATAACWRRTRPSHRASPPHRKTPRRQAHRRPDRTGASPTRAPGVCPRQCARRKQPPG